MIKMKALIPIFFGLYLLQNFNEPLQQISPIKYKENIKLKGYGVNQTYKFSNSEMFLIAKENFETGYQLIYLNKSSNEEFFSKSYVSSEGKGEAYVYNPYFYKSSDNEFIILAEEGYEYMSGIDVYLLRNEVMKFVGYVPVSGSQGDSVIPNLEIKKQGSGYEISFEGRIEYKAATDNLIDGSKLKVHFSAREFTIIEQ